MGNVDIVVISIVSCWLHVHCVVLCWLHGVVSYWLHGVVYNSLGVSTQLCSIAVYSVYVLANLFIASSVLYGPSLMSPPRVVGDKGHVHV